jgi:hypothetical protein
MCAFCHEELLHIKIIIIFNKLFFIAVFVGWHVRVGVPLSVSVTCASHQHQMSGRME